MSSSATHARPSLARRLPAATAPVLCGAAAFAAVSAPATSMAATQAPAGPHAVTAKNPVAGPEAKAAKAAKYVAKHAKTPAKTATAYTVKSGDSLSAIARHYYQEEKFWPVLYWANHHHIRYANDIKSGQILKVPAKPAAIPALPSTLSAPALVEQSAPVSAAPAQSTEAQSATVSTAGDSAFQRCVISRESGGNSQVMNSSGHYGLYQFSSSTWAAYGGNPADFGHASTAEQNRVFDNAMARGGQSNWSAYDGC